MTRRINSTYHCEHCGKESTCESGFSRWIRNNTRLASRNGFCLTDQDVWWQQYKRNGRRDFQLCAEIEIKTYGADLRDSQRDSLYIKDQFMRNRSDTPTKTKIRQPGNSLRVMSAMNGRLVNVRFLGVHLLRFSHAGPDDSTWIKWNKRPITLQQLEDILAFDVDPDTLRIIDLRNHHIDKDKFQRRLFND